MCRGGAITEPAPFPLEAMGVREFYTPGWTHPDVDAWTVPHPGVDPAFRTSVSSRASAATTLGSVNPPSRRSSPPIRTISRLLLNPTAESSLAFDQKRRKVALAQWRTNYHYEQSVDNIKKQGCRANTSRS